MPENAREVFVENLTRLMRERGIDQSAIASALGLTASTVSDWVNGKKYPRVDSMQRLADFFGVPMSALTIQQSPDRDRIHEISESLQHNPKLGLLFDRSRKMSERDLDAVLGIVEAILKERDDD